MGGAMDIIKIWTVTTPEICYYEDIVKQQVIYKKKWSLLLHNVDTLNDIRYNNKMYNHCVLKIR